LKKSLETGLHALTNNDFAKNMPSFTRTLEEQNKYKPINAPVLYRDILLLESNLSGQITQWRSQPLNLSDQISTVSFRGKVGLTSFKLTLDSGLSTPFLGS